MLHFPAGKLLVSTKPGLIWVKIALSTCKPVKTASGCCSSRGRVSPRVQTKSLRETAAGNGVVGRDDGQLKGQTLRGFRAAAGRGRRESGVDKFRIGRMPKRVKKRQRRSR